MMERVGEADRGPNLPALLAYMGGLGGKGVSENVIWYVVPKVR
jgi:hypothetical protein